MTLFSSGTNEKTKLLQSTMKFRFNFKEAQRKNLMLILLSLGLRWLGIANKKLIFNKT